ncbi:MAG: ABC transporter permease, partial [Planctomycetota bacterium]|nr:ABC transporter permease [Planctomycetota bacterium]
NAGSIGAVILLFVALPCLVTLPWSLHRFDLQRLDGGQTLAAPSLAEPMGTDLLGRSILWRVLLGGSISLGIGIAAASIAVVIGVFWGGLAGYIGGRTDACLMRIVDVLYGLPSVLLIVLVNMALKPAIIRAAGSLLPADAAASIGDVATLLIAIGGVSWLTMARVIRGQVLSLRGQPFVEAARALGLSPARIFCVHLLPNLVGPIVVYTTLTVPSAILQESFLSFLGIGVQPPLPTWGNLAADGLGELHSLGMAHGSVRWWLLLWPCALLGLTLMALNFLGDGLRDRLDPRSGRLGK